MAEIGKHFPNPPGASETYKRPSLVIHSPNTAGGEVPVGQYRQPKPAPTPAPATTPPGTTIERPAHWRR
jgi:hypothetical protein